MSQGGILNSVGGPIAPTIPTSFVEDSGTAIPSSNTLHIVGGTGVTTRGSGNTVVINGSGGGFTWNNVTGTTAVMAAQNAYQPNNASLVTLSYGTGGGAGFNFGDTILVKGLGAGGWTITQFNSGDQIIFGNKATTPGSGGSLSSSNQYDVVALVCTATAAPGSLIWQVIYSIGNLTIV